MPKKKKFNHIVLSNQSQREIILKIRKGQKYMICIALLWLFSNKYHSEGDDFEVWPITFLYGWLCLWPSFLSFLFLFFCFSFVLYPIPNHQILSPKYFSNYSFTEGRRGPFLSLFNYYYHFLRFASYLHPLLLLLYVLYSDFFVNLISATFQTLFFSCLRVGSLFYFLPHACQHVWSLQLGFISRERERERPNIKWRESSKLILILRGMRKRKWSSNQMTWNESQRSSIVLVYIV